MAQKFKCSNCGKSFRVTAGAVPPAVCLACGRPLSLPPELTRVAGERAPADVPPVSPLAPPDAGQAAARAEVPPSAAASAAGSAPSAPAAPAPPGRPARTFAWLAAGAVCCAVGVLVAAAAYTSRATNRDARAQVAALKGEAERLVVSGDLAAAYRKYEDLARSAAELRDDPAVAETAGRARAEQEKVYAILLARQLDHAGGGAVTAKEGDNEQPGGGAETVPATQPAVAEPPAAPDGDDTAGAKGQGGRVPVEIGQGAAVRGDAGDPPPAGRPARPPGSAGDEPPGGGGVRPGGEARAAPEAETERPARPRPAAARRPPLRPQPEPASGVTDEQIGRAIGAGADYLLRQFDADTHTLAGGYSGRADRAYRCGANALAVYALMQCGHSIPDRRLDVHNANMKALIEAMKAMPAEPGHPVVYARAIRATALALFARPEDKKALAADVKYLLAAHKSGAYTYLAVDAKRGPGRAGAWDNSNSQYGLLGVWSGAEAGVEVPSKYWADVEKHWASCQSANGQWGYREGGNGGTLSMTAAGTASLFVTHDYLWNGRHGIRVGREPFSPELRKALDWWEQGDNAVRTGFGGWWGYTLYGIERVGLASGFKYLGRHDWYRTLAAQVLAAQSRDGSWGDPVETSYALLFLARGRHPVLMNKLRFDGYWANRPRDAANLADYAGEQLERPLNWQVVTPDRQWWDWLDSPILYVASHEPPQLRPEHYDKLRNYARAGGLIFTQADGDAPEFDRWAKRTAERLFPAYEMRDLPPGHPIYNVVFKVEPRPVLKAVSNGARVLMVHAPADVSKFWQLRDSRTVKHAFQFGTNLFVYAAGKRELRNRLQSPYVTDPGRPHQGTIKVARLEYAGNWDPEPGAWERYARRFQRQTGTALGVRKIGLRDLAPGDAPFAHLTGTARYEPTGEEVAALRRYVVGGGVLLVDACGGGAAFADGVGAALGSAFSSARTPTRFSAVGDGHPLLKPGPPGMSDLAKPRLRPYALEKLGPRAAPRLEAISAGAGHVLLTRLDLTSGLLGTGTWGILGYEPAYAQDLMKNAILWAVDGAAEPGLTRAE